MGGGSEDQGAGEGGSDSQRAEEERIVRMGRGCLSQTGRMSAALRGLITAASPTSGGRGLQAGGLAALGKPLWAWSP